MRRLQHLKAILPKGQFTRNVAILAGGTAFGQLILALTSPLLARLYMPEDFGLLAAFISIFSLLLTINSLRYELAIPLPEDDVEAASITILVLLLVLTSTLVFGLFFWILGSSFVRWINLPDLQPYLWLLLVSLLGAGFYQAFTYWAIRKKAFNPIARTKLVQSLSQVVVQLIGGFLGLGTPGLISGYTLGQVSGSTTLGRLSWATSKAAFQRVTFSIIREIAWRYRKFPIFMSWASLVNSAGLQLPVLILGTVYGPVVAGWYALGQRLVAIPMTMIGTSIGQVYFSTASQMKYDDPAGLNALFSKTARNLFLLGAVPLAVLAITGQWLFEIVLGQNWRTSGEFVQLMTPMFLAQFVASTLAQTILVLERPDLQSAWDVVRLIVVIVIFVAASALSLPSQVTIGLYSAGMTIMYIVLFVINKSLLRKYNQVKNYA